MMGDNGRHVEPTPRVSGFALVALAALLWGSDALFRVGLALQLPAAAVVFAEHVILVIVTLPLLMSGVKAARSIDGRDWVTLVVIGAGASAAATVLFTQAFAYGDPTTPLLLQKLQPAFAIGGGHLILGERLLPRYGLYFSLAVTGAYLVAFPEPFDVGVRGVIPAALALAAAVLWGVGTALGRRMTEKIEFAQLTAIRFAIGLPASAAILFLLGEHGSLSTIGLRDSVALLLLALVPGLAAMLIYYRGLRETPAASAALAELAFPVSALTINYLVFDAVLTTSQWIGFIILTAAIMVMSRVSASAPEALGVVRRLRRRPGLEW